MPQFGDNSIQKSLEKSENEGVFIKLKDGESIEVYPMFFYGEKPDDIEEEEKTSYQPAEVYKLVVWMDKDFVSSYNEKNEDSKLANVFNLEVPPSYMPSSDFNSERSNVYPQAWSDNAMSDPVAWFLEAYYSNEELNNHVSPRISKQFKKANRLLTIEHRVMLWFLDASGANRYFSMSPTGYQKMRNLYNKMYRNLDSVFMQRHNLVREGDGFKTAYELTHVDNGEGFEVEKSLLVPLNSEHFGIDFSDSIQRKEAVQAIIGTDEFFPLSAEWMNNS